MLYEIRFEDTQGRFRVASAIPADMLELIVALIERIAVRFSIETVKGV